MRSRIKGYMHLNLSGWHLLEWPFNPMNAYPAGGMSPTQPKPYFIFSHFLFHSPPPPRSTSPLHRMKDNVSKSKSVRKCKIGERVHDEIDWGRNWNWENKELEWRRGFGDVGKWDFKVCCLRLKNMRERGLRFVVWRWDVWKSYYEVELELERFD